MNYFAIGALSGAIVVLLGAFGAHGLKDIINDYELSVYNKAVLYHMFHTIGIFILGSLDKLYPTISFLSSGWSFLVGIILFSGSLYLLSALHLKWFGMITPFGGVAFVVGWILLFGKLLQT